MDVNLDLLLAQLQSMAASFGPWGLLAAAAIGVWLSFRKPKTTPPATPTPPASKPPALDELREPVVPPLAPITNRPLINLGLNVLARIAAKRFAHLPPEEALERYVVEQVQYEHAVGDRAAGHK